MEIRRALAPRMIGRHAHIDELAARLRVTRSEEGRIILLAGEAGVGKTRLCRTFVDKARGWGEIQILQGHCYDEDPTTPFGPFLDALRVFLYGDSVYGDSVTLALSRAVGHPAVAFAGR